MSLQQQIEEEMQREARIEKIIAKEMKKFFFRNPANKQFAIQPTKEGADAFIIFKHSNLYNYRVCIFSGKDDDRELDQLRQTPGFSIVFLKNKNNHDSLRTTYGFSKSKAPLTQKK